ncbi:MAG: hypothetical protein P1V51_08860 [Deltaproteobacteria bacterium]|nr:hypothetical protein [Deltaproteobacteria bacterium]
MLPRALLLCLSLAALPSPAPAEEAPPAASPLSAAEAEARYQEAFDALVEGEDGRALFLLEGLVEATDDPELRARATALRDLAQARAAHAATTLEEEAPGTYARWAFITGATVGGLALGAEAAVAFQLRSSTVVAGTLIFSTGAAFTGALLGSKRLKLTLPEASLFDWGLVMGTYQAVLLGLALEVERPTLGGFALLGTVLGGALGLYGTRLAGLESGDSSLVATGLVWGSLAGVLLIPLLSVETDAEIATVLLAGSAGGLGLGILAAYGADMSRGRVLGLNLGILLGGLVAGGLAVMATELLALDVGFQLVPGAAMVGMLVGGFSALYLSGKGRTPAWLASTHLGAIEVGVGPPMIFPDTRGHAALALPAIHGRF